jgi:hypothetical protein
MPYLLGLFAIAAPVVLVVQAIRGRVRVRCCGIEASQDLRMRDALRDGHETAAP